jgi:hypothetical protein
MIIKRCVITRARKILSFAKRRKKDENSLHTSMGGINCYTIVNNRSCGAFICDTNCHLHEEEFIDDFYSNRKCIFRWAKRRTSQQLRSALVRFHLARAQLPIFKGKLSHSITQSNNSLASFISFHSKESQLT